MYNTAAKQIKACTSLFTPCFLNWQFSQNQIVNTANIYLNNGINQKGRLLEEN